MFRNGRIRRQARDRGQSRLVTGVRVCCVHPGAVWTPSWANSGFTGEKMMPAEDIARAILNVYRLSRRTVVEEIILRPQAGDL